MSTRSERDTFGPIEVPADRLWGAQTQRSLTHFKISGERMPPAAPACPRPGEEGRRDVNVDARRARREEGPGDRAGGGRGPGREARRRVPARGLADRQRHADQHEHERGPGQPGQRDPGRRARREAAGAPQRRRQQGPVQQRRLPDRHERGRIHGGGGAADPGGEGPARRAAPQGGGLPRRGEDRPHAPAGRHPAHAGPGVLRLRRAARPRPRTPARRPAPRGRAGAGRHRRGHRPQRPSRVRGSAWPNASRS